MSDLAGATLGRYQVIGRLGRGGMADVYKGFQPSLDRYVAIKVLHPSMVEEAEFVQRFQREAKNVARLRHPNIIQVFDYDNQGEIYYMVMEFLDGPTLKAALEEVHLRKEEMPLQVALRIVSDVGAALAYAHEVGVVHRDIKPANIMLDRSGRVILTDFGIAKMLTGAKVTVTGTVLGTPAYMSPEQGMGEPGDSRSDIYSLGVVLYELATGRLPYDADTPLAVLLKHVHDPLPMPHSLNPSLPDEVERIILRSLAKNPADRYPTVHVMVDDIAALPPATVPAAQPGALNTRVLAARAPRSAASIPAQATPPPSRTTGSTSRRSFLLGGGAIIAVVACLGLIAAGALALYFTRDNLVGLVAGNVSTATSAPTATPTEVPSLATSAPTATPTEVPSLPTRTPPPSTIPLGPAGSVLFKDDFSDTGSGWTRLEDSDGGSDYGDGVFRIWVKAPQVDYWATAGRTFADARIAVSTFKAAGPDDNDFGVICRYQDNDNFYAFLISSDGYYGIMRMQNGERTMVGNKANEYLTSSAIHQGGTTNEIVAECIGDRLALHVNGELVADEQDTAFRSGDVGLIAGTFDEPGAEIHFDDFVVYRP